MFSLSVFRNAKKNEGGEVDTQQSMQIAFKNEAPKAGRLQMWSGSMYVCIYIYIGTGSWGRDHNAGAMWPEPWGRDRDAEAMGPGLWGRGHGAKVGCGGIHFPLIPPH